MTLLRSDRWNVLCPTPWALRHARHEMIDGPIVAVEGARWGKHEFHVWASLSDTAIQAEARRQPFGDRVFELWGPHGSRHVADKMQWPFDVLLPEYVIYPKVPGPQGVPRPANALFLALDKLCEERGAKEIRVWGAGWGKGENRWQLYALGKCVEVADAHGIEITLAPLKVDPHVDNPR